MKFELITYALDGHGYEETPTEVLHVPLDNKPIKPVASLACLLQKFSKRFVNRSFMTIFTNLLQKKKKEYRKF